MLTSGVQRSVNKVVVSELFCKFFVKFVLLDENHEKNSIELISERHKLC